MSNSMIQKPKFSVAIRSDAYKNMINNTLGDPERAKRFIASVSSAVGVNKTLQECDAGSIVTAALLGESLNLSPSPQLGYYYMVPFEDKKGGCKKAQFILGYKGFVQLAARSGSYAKINVLEIKEGEFKSFDPLNEVLECVVITDPDLREAAPTVGYYAMFEYLNGFRKALYWSKRKMEAHADQYSKAFSLVTYQKIQRGEIPEKDMWKYSSFWYKDFDDMAKKTMLRQLISRWGIMSTELQMAYEADGAVIERGEDGEFVSAPVEESPALPQETKPNPPTEPEAEGIGEPMSLDDFEED